MEIQEQQPKPRKFFQQYGVIVAILIGAWIIGMSIILAGLLIVRHLDGTQSFSGVQTVDIPESDKDVVLGNPNAAVTIIEYADFQCPFCKQFQDLIFPSLKTNYIDQGKAKFIFRDFAFLGQESLDAAEAAKCAKDQGKFWEYHDRLYASQGEENSGTFSQAALKGFAGSLGLDQAKFNTCLDSHTHKADVDAETQGGSGYGVDSTPTVFINGKLFSGVDKLVNYNAVIDEELKKQSTLFSWLKDLFKSK